MEMMSQNGGEKKGKRKRCTKLKHGRSGDKKKSSSPKPNLVEMVSQNADGASGEKNNSSSPKPNLMDDDRSAAKKAATKPRKKDLKSDAALMALYERWCCYYKISRTPDEMKERFNRFKKSANSVYKSNKKSTSCSYGLFRFADFTRKELWRRPICRPCPPCPSRW